MSQVRNFKDQYLAIFKNVFLLGYRSKELMAEAIFPFIVGCAMLVKNILLLLSFLAPIIVALSINGSTRALLIRLVEEKSGRLKEIQKIMGMKQKPYFLAWYSAALIRAFVSGFLFLVIPIALATKSGYAPEQYTKSGIQIAPSFLDQENYIGFWDLFYGGKVGQFILFFIIYCICAVNQSFMLSSLFSKTKLAGEVSTFLTTITTLLVFLVYWSKFETSKIGYYLISIFPQAGCAFAYVTAVRSPVYYTANVVVQDYFTLNEATYMMSGMAILYICLYFYFEQVMPNEFGISKHPLWFLKSKSQNLNNSSIIASGSRLSQGERKFNSSSINDTKNENSALLENQKLKVSLIGGDQQENLENVDTSSAIYHQPFDNVNNYQRTVEIKNMSKRFGSTKAVNRISLSLYEKNIFCLLGHNGAGKTTTISVLTGLIRKSGGSVKMYGMDLEDDLELIRKNLGICTQRDVVYEDLTFEEQLRFIARIKGIPEDQIQNEINIMLDKTKCHGEKGKLVKNLSGGNKRKLSLAMALIGGSKIVFLDEPTSGMDAISRRAIWDILETVREEERTIVLTTHHLDEAEVLADRIGIMAKGKLLAVGSTDYIKKNFGIGYHLSIFPDPQGVKLQFGDEIKEKVFQIVRSRLKSAVLNPQSRKDVMQFLVGFEDKERFGETFEEIEQIPGLMIGLEMNSLEDAFVNVGMDEEKFIQQSQNKVIVNIDKNQVNEEENQAKFTQFKDIKQPQCLSRPPNYSFQAQFTACFYRKYYCTVRTFTNYLAFIIPLVLLIAGAFIVQVLSSDLGNDQKIIVFGLFICIAYAFNGGIYIMLPVQERELHLKYALNVMGCRPLPYWLATFCFDYIIFSLTIISFMLVSLIGNVEYIKENAFGLALNLFCFGISFIPFSYMCGFMFKKGNSAMKIFPVLNFFVSYLVTFSVLGIIGLLFMESYINETVWKILSIPFTVLFLAFSPFYAMNWGVNLIPVYGSDYAQYSQGNYFYVISFNYLVYVAIMLAEGLLYIGITYYLEQQKYNLSAVNADQESLEELEPIEDQEVNREKQRILQLDVENNYATQGSQIGQAVEKVIVSNLWKRYDNGFIAIKDTNFGIKKGEILGLLGPNGAGKSTTFNILTSRIPRTLGSVKIKNIQVDKGIMEIYNDVGICPQFDCIWTNLTPVEHLYLFGRMKGLRGKDLDEAVEYFIKIMQLEDFRKTKAGNLSGGNKRKLCVSDALIGGPDIQFFDEPSTGVDPIARRFLWNTLQQGQKLRNSAIVLTTHTMDEAESLCTKIAIQINGRFQCLGSPAELRRKYGEGYTIIAKLMNDSTKGEFSSKLREQFQNIRILPDKKENVYNYRIPGKEFSFAKAFKFCEQAKKENLIEDFSINQSSLEEVFVYFSKFQPKIIYKIQVYINIMSDLENSQNNILREIDDTDQYDGNDIGQDFSLSRNSQSQQNLQGLNNFYNSNIYNKLKIEDYYTPYNTLQGYIEEFNKQISGLLKKSEDDFLHAYKEQMTKIQKELKTLKRKIDEETKKQKTNDKMNILEQERDYFRAEALRLDKICKDQLRDLEELKFKIQILTEDKDYYENFVIETKKENKALKSELLFLYKNKIKNHQKEQDLENNINEEENNNNTKESNKFVSADFEFGGNKSSSKTEQKPSTTQQETKPFYMTQPEFKPSNFSNRAVSQQQFSRARKIDVGGVQIQDDQKIEKRFLETTKNLRQYLERERNINQKLKAELTANNIQRTQLEEILLDCINEAKKDIQKRRLLQKESFQSISRQPSNKKFNPFIEEEDIDYNKFSHTDKINLLKKFISSEAFLKQIYQITFENSVRATTAETRPQTQSTVPGKRLQMSWKQDFKDAMSIYHNQFKGFKYSFSTRNLGRDSVQKKDLQSPYYQFSNQTKDKIKKIQAIKINKNG